MDDVATIVLGLEPHGLAAEVMDFLDRTGRTRVVVTVADAGELTREVRRAKPHAVVASPGLAAAAGDLNGSSLLVVDTAESVRSLREALRAGARGFYLWPSERDELARAAAGLSSVPTSPGDRRALVLAVYGPRGGAGTTFLATHLASALARLGRDTVLVDMDTSFGDVTGALGVPHEPAHRTIADLDSVIRELSPRHVSGVLWQHPRGFRALLAAEDPGGVEAIGLGHYAAAVGILSRSADVVVLHLPRALDDLARSAMEMAHRVVMVLTLDVLAFRHARRALDVLSRTGLEERCDLVVNRVGRSELRPADVERVFGRRPLALIRSDRAVPRAQDRGRLLSPRSRTGRTMAGLAERLLGEAS